ncbi:MAG: hypothetical protein ACE5SW_11915 [Nitrososphaeraceae archaeon]
MNTQISKNSAVFLAAVLVAGTISMIVPSSFAQSYEDPYAQDPYAKDQKKSTSVNVQKIKCVNENLNVNGVEVNQVPETGVAAAEAQADDASAANGNGLQDGNGNGINLDKNLVNICVNVNLNGQIDGGLLGLPTPIPMPR